MRGASRGSDGITAGVGFDAAFGSRFTAFAALSGEWSTSADATVEFNAGVVFNF